ncbi:MAG: GNAT family N-acetyltransferase [Deltaproteobacteria bacterium]|nr:GNAT family N-acetyltransferase [Deltaproteobacteria bacterium]
MEDLIIRKLNREDARDISRINAAITRKPVKEEFGPMVEELAQSTGNMSYIAEYQGEIVGYMITYLLSGGFGIEKSAWIADVGVEPKFMGQGIGKALASEIFKFYSDKKIKNIYTSVRWDSTDLLSFFKTLGFDRSNFINLRKQME